LSKLLASGCSWTDPSFKTDIHPLMDCSWPKWPELVLGDWDEVVNLARSGAGLDYMIPTLIEYIMMHDDVSHIILQFSSWYRWKTPEGFFQNPTLAISKSSDGIVRDKLRPTLSKMIEIENFFPTTHRSIHIRLNNYLILLNALVELCLYKNIKFIGWQGLQFAKSRKKDIDRVAYKEFVNHKLFHKLDKLYNSGKVDFLNWPLVDTMADCMETILPKDNGFRISNYDSHPSKIGQKFIADWINQNATTI